RRVLRRLKLVLEVDGRAGNRLARRRIRDEHPRCAARENARDSQRAQGADRDRLWARPHDRFSEILVPTRSGGDSMTRTAAPGSAAFVRAFTRRTLAQARRLRDTQVERAPPKREPREP